jgi:hypothetical protein
MVISPGNEKTDLDRAQNLDAPWPAMGETTGWVRVLREVLLEVSWADEQVLPDRCEG